VIIQPGQVSHLPSEQPGTEPHERSDQTEEEHPLEPVRQVLRLASIGVERHERTDRHAGGHADEERAANFEDQRGRDHRQVHSVDGGVLHAAGEIHEQPRQRQRECRGGGRGTAGPK
jgi:hypothetical protein